MSTPAPSQTPQPRTRQAKGKTQLAPFPWLRHLAKDEDRDKDEFLPVPIYFPRLMLKYPGVGAVMLLVIIRRTAGAYKLGRPEECQITDEEFIAETKAEPETIRRCKRLLEADGLIPKLAPGQSDRRRTYRINYDIAEKIAIPERMSPGSGPKCKPRTEPEPQVVMVRVPGSLIETPIDAACAHVGGKGAACSCPLHHYKEGESKANVKNTFVDNKEVKEALPQVDVGLDFPAPHRPDPPPTPPKAPVASATSDKQDSKLSLARLRDGLKKVCLDAFEMLPDDELLRKIGIGMAWRPEVLPYVEKRIRAECIGTNGKPKPGKRLALIHTKLVALAVADANAFAERDAAIPAAPATEDDRARQRYREHPDEREWLRMNNPHITDWEEPPSC